MNLYLLNALIIPFETKNAEIAAFIAQKISQDRYVEILTMAKKENLNIKSYIGHKSTVDFLKEILPAKLKSIVKYNREHLFLEDGDLALVFRVSERGDSLKEYSLDELRDFHKKGKVEFVLISRIFAPELILNPNIYFQKGGK